MDAHPMSYSAQHLERNRSNRRRVSTPRSSSGWPSPWPSLRAAAAGCSCSASAAARPTARTPSTTSASLAGIEAYAPTDNVSELTARVNDEGWDTVFLRVAPRQPADRQGHGFADLLRGRRQPGEERQRRLDPRIGLCPPATRGGILGVVGRDGGYTARVADICVIVPTVNPGNVTPACRGDAGRRLAPLGVASVRETIGDEVGVVR